MAAGLRFEDKYLIFSGLEAITPPSTSTSKWISLKDAHAVTVKINVVNGAAGVTGSAITLNQALAVSGTNSKALGFAYVMTSVDTANSVAWTNTAVASNTFTTLNTASRKASYIFTVNPGSLDTANGFDCLQVAAATGVNTTLNIEFILYPRYAGGFNSFANPLVD